MELTKIAYKNLNWKYPRFFSEIKPNDEFQYIKGKDAHHIKTVLRIKKEGKIIVSNNGTDYVCEVIDIFDDNICIKIIDEQKNIAEAGITLNLFQCLPKLDKFDFITQKSTELGVSTITPVISKRCVSKPDLKSKVKKLERWQKIAEEASKQSGRGKIPIINDFTTFDGVIDKFNIDNLGIIFYECGGEKLNEIVGNKTFNTIDIIIGSEGGFEIEEVELAIKKGYKAATLGNRILRTETAPISAISILMNLTGNV